jgi:RNA polymerase subunit RPABC4/transcription elongation factor Spt4
MNFTKFKLFVLLSPNRPPVLNTIKTKVVKLSSDLWLEDFEATDDYTPKNELVWSLKSNASWLTINPATGEIEQQLELNHFGTYWVNVTVTDEKGLFNFTNFTLVVQSTNRNPRLYNAGMSPETGDEDTEFTFFVTYMDLDNDSGSVYIVIDNKRNLLIEDPADNRNYYRGVNFSKTITLDAGVHTYYFEAVDEWGFKAILEEGVPSNETPAQTSEIDEVVVTPWYEKSESWLWIGIYIVIFLIIFIIVIGVLRKLSKRYPSLEFANKIKPPDRINPYVWYEARREREVAGEFGFLCPSCKSVVDKDAENCSACGEEFVDIEYLCPNCSGGVSAADQFCPSCGSKFEELEVEPELESEPIDELEVAISELPEPEEEPELPDVEEPEPKAKKSEKLAEKEPIYEEEFIPDEEPEAEDEDEKAKSEPDSDEKPKDDEKADEKAKDKPKDETESSKADKKKSSISKLFSKIGSKNKDQKADKKK